MFSTASHGTPRDLPCCNQTGRISSGILPTSNLLGSEKNSGEDSGVWHFLPLINVRQLQFLRLKKCKSVDDIDDNVHASWANDELLHLDNVLKLSFRELKAQLQVTAIILDSISVETARRVRRDSVHADPSLTDV